MNEVERQVMDFLLRGAHPVLALLREQLPVAEVVERKFSGIGFFTYFRVPPSAPRVPSCRRIVISDVDAEIEGLQHGAGFVLFVDEGILHMLEGFAYAASWPTDAKLKRIYYMHRKTPGSSAIVETAQRDLAW